MGDIKKYLRTINKGKYKYVLEEYDLDSIKDVTPTENLEKDKKYIPEIYHKLRHRSVKMPEAIYECSGINILGKRIKSLLFTTDIAIISNSNADAVMAVYPFTAQLSITQAILNNSSVPVLAGVGGGTTNGKRSVYLSLQSELMGVYGVVVNAPMPNEDVKEMAAYLDIPIVATVSSTKDDYKAKIEAGAGILNVSGGADTAELVRKIREEIGPHFPIIATGGPTDSSIRETIKAGANAITYTPPTSADIFAQLMEDYRKTE